MMLFVEAGFQDISIWDLLYLLAIPVIGLLISSIAILLIAVFIKFVAKKFDE